jgi:hypothetical protein
MTRTPVLVTALVLAAGTAGAQGRFRTPILETALNVPTSNDVAPTLSQDALTLWFCSDRPGGAGSYDVYVTTRASISAPWSAPVTEPALNSSLAENYIAVRGDGQEMYISGNRTGTSGVSDIWVATRSGPAWNTPTNVTELNSIGLEDDPSLTGDALEIFITSNRAGSVGAAAVWRSTRPNTTSPWTTPVRVAEIDTASAEHSPSISDDGLTLFYASDMPGGLGSSDFWVAKRPDRNSPFGTAVNVTEVNTVQWDFNADLTADEFTLYPCSYPGGITTGDILRADGILPRTVTFTQARVGLPWSVWCRRDPGDVGGLAFSAVAIPGGIPVAGIQGLLYLGFPLFPLPPGVLDANGRYTFTVGAVPNLPGATIHWQSFAQDTMANIYLGNLLSVTIVP